jgi:hypothetical protein
MRPGLSQSWSHRRDANSLRSAGAQSSRMLACVVTLLDEVSPDAKVLLNILIDARNVADDWPVRQYVEHQLATAGLDTRAVFDGLPLWHHTYRAIRILPSKESIPDAPPELGARVAPTVYGLVHCQRPFADTLTKAFLTAVAVGYQAQLSSLPDPTKVRPVTLSSEALTATIGRRLGVGGTLQARHVRQLLSGEPATWSGVNSDPDAPDWTWNLWFGSLRDYAVDSGEAYLAVLEQLIGIPRTPDAWTPTDPAALPRALDYLDLVWRACAGQRLFQRPAFARSASLAAPVASEEEFKDRCDAAYDVLSRLTVPTVDDVEGRLNHLKIAMEKYLPDFDQRQRATEAVDRLRDVVAVRRSQAHSGASAETMKAAARLGIRLAGHPTQRWDQVRQVMVQAIYALSDELEPPGVVT